MEVRLKSLLNEFYFFTYLTTNSMMFQDQSRFAHIGAKQMEAFFLSMNQVSVESDNAVEYYSMVVALQPNDSQAFVLLGDAYYARYDYPQARACYQTALEIAPSNIWAAHSLKTMNYYGW
jgi:cytochrome c-type biogenesis protein CcmH/NrfG